MLTALLTAMLYDTECGEYVEQSVAGKLESGRNRSEPDPKPTAVLTAMLCDTECGEYVEQSVAEHRLAFRMTQGN